MAPRRLQLSVLVAAAAAVCSSGCTYNPFAPKPAMQAWVAGEMTSLTDRTPASMDPLIYDSTQNAVTLFAGANETVSFQLVVEGGANKMTL